MTRRRVAITLGVVLVAAVAGAWGLRRSGSPRPRGVAGTTASETTITERTITSQHQVDGTLGFAGGASVVQPVGTAPDAVTQADHKAAAAAQSLAQARAALSVAEVSDDFRSVAQAQANLISAEQSYSSARSDAADANTSALAFGPTSAYTALPAVGQVLTRGQPLFSVSAQPVPLLYGSVTPWRPFQAGMSVGPDVAELNQNLAALGYGPSLAGSDSFGRATYIAVRKLQRAGGLPETGELLRGSVVFEPGPVRVTAVTTKLGAAVEPGSTVLDVTSTTREIKVKLDAAAQSEVNVGDPVTITLPNNRTTPGTVTSVGTVATQPPSNGPDSNSQPTVDVVITPTDSAATGNLDAAPVQVSITTATADHALVVPVTALLAVSGGGYGVDVIAAGGAHHLEVVTLGLFDDAGGLVQVSGPNVRAGQKVVAASS